MRGAGIIVLLALLWGLNYPAIKISNESFSPVFAAFVRSSAASLLGLLYCRFIGQRFFHRGPVLWHGAVVGFLFGAEFLFLYLGLRYTDAARAVLLVYLSPFVVALGAHIFLKERLDGMKTAGLLLAFFGVWLVFAGKPRTYGPSMLFGDVCEIVAAVLWAATTLYIKRFLALKVHPVNTFLYQLVFSIPVLFFGALVLEPVWVREVTGLAILSLLVYQSVIIAFLSYLAWFWLIHSYPVARLSAFTFLTPVFGVLSGVFLLGESMTLLLAAALAAVSAGIYLANYKRAA